MEHAEHPIYSYLKVPVPHARLWPSAEQYAPPPRSCASLFGSLVIQIIRSDLVSDFRPARETWNHGSSLGGAPYTGYQTRRFPLAGISQGMSVFLLAEPVNLIHRLKHIRPIGRSVSVSISSCLITFRQRDNDAESITSWREIFLFYLARMLRLPC